MKVKEESEKADLKLNIQKTEIMASGPITSWQIDGETMETVRDFILGAPKSLQMVTAAMKLKDTFSLEESYDQPRQHVKKQRCVYLWWIHVDVWQNQYNIVKLKKKKTETLLFQLRSVWSRLWFFQ